MNKGRNVTVMLVGSLPDIAFCLAVQELEIDKPMPIPTKILRNAGLGSLGKQTVKIEPDHIFVIKR